MKVTFVGYFADKQEFVRQDEQTAIILGDPTVPYGFWKAIEHMRKGEKALVMIKPKWGFNHPEFRLKLKIPEGWEDPDRLRLLRKRRVFYEIKL